MARGLSVFVNIGARVGSSVGSAAAATERRFGQMNRRLRVMAAETSAHMRATERQWGSIRRNASDFAMGVSAPMGVLAGLGAKTAYEWAQVGNNLQAVTQMTHEQRKAVEAAARSQIGNPVNNLRAGLDLGRTGLAPDEIAAGLPIAVRLARSDPESVDQAQAADIVTNILKGMRMPIGELGRAADVIAYAAAQSSSDVRLMGESFKYAGPLAARAGTSIEEAAAAFMTMADAGIKGSESGVAFRSMLVRMIKLPKPAAAVLARYNMQISDYVKLSNAPSGQGIINSLKASGIAAGGAASELDRILGSNLAGADLVEALTSAVSRGIEGGADAVDREMLSTVISDALIGSADKINWRKFIADARAKGWTTGDIVNFFDTRQGARLATLFGDDLENTLSKMKGQGGSSGWLDKMFALQNQGVVGSMQRLAQSMGKLIITISEAGVIDTAANAIDKLANGISALGKSNPALLKFGTYAVLALAVLGPLGWLMGGVVAGFRLLGGAVMFLGRMAAGPLGRFAGMVTRLWRLGGLVAAIGGRAALIPLLAPLGLLGVALGAVALAVAWIVAKWSGIKAFFSGMKEGFVEAVGPEGMASIQKFGEALRWVADVLFTPWKMLAGAIGAVFNWIGQLFAPAETEKWRSGGESFGRVIGGMVKGLTGFIDLITTGINKIREFFGASNAGGAAGAAIGAQMGAATTRQRGGGLGRGSLALVGERGPELFASGRSGTVIPARATAALIAAMSGGIPVQSQAAPIQTGDIHIHGATDPAATAQAVRAELKRLQREQRAGLHD